MHSQANQAKKCPAAAIGKYGFGRTVAGGGRNSIWT
jgi:hypothetical protein